MDNYNENKYKLRIDALTQQLTKVGNEYYATVEVLKAKDIELNETRHELNEIRHEFLLLMNSKSWKITRPLRYVVKSFKLLLK